MYHASCLRKRTDARISSREIEIFLAEKFRRIFIRMNIASTLNDLTEFNSQNEL